MKIRLEKYSQVGNNALVNLYFDDLLINPSGPLQMSPKEYEELLTIFTVGTEHYVEGDHEFES